MDTKGYNLSAFEEFFFIATMQLIFRLTSKATKNWRVINSTANAAIYGYCQLIKCQGKKRMRL